MQYVRSCIHPGSAFPCIGLCASGQCTSACFERTRVGRCSRRSFVVFLRMDRSCCLVACLFSGRSAELSGTGTSPYAFINFLSCQQSRVRHWPWYISYRLAFPGILLCSFVHMSQAFCELMLVALRSAVVWGRPARGLLAFLVAVVGIVGYKCHIPIHGSLEQRCLQGTQISTSGKGLGKPVHSAVCCCPHAHGSLLFAVVAGFWVSPLPPSSYST